MRFEREINSEMLIKLKIYGETANAEGLCSPISQGKTISWEFTRLFFQRKNFESDLLLLFFNAYKSATCL